MTIMSPSTCTSLRAVTFMLSEVYLYLVPVMLIVDLNLAKVVQHSPFPVSCLCLRSNTVQVISVPKSSLRSRVVCVYAHDDHCLSIQTLTVFSLKWSPHKQLCPTNIICIHTKPLPVSRVFWACSGSPWILAALVPIHTVFQLNTPFTEFNDAK